MNRSNTAPALALAGVNAAAGVLHFVKPEPFDGLIPHWLPGEPRTWTHASGVAELATAGLMAVPATRRIGGLLATGVYAAVWPGNMQMVANWRDKPWPMKALAWGRLPLQVWLMKQAWSVARSTPPTR